MSNGNILAGIAFDYRSYTYTGANTYPDTTTLKRGGASGVVVGVVTYTYDGSGRLLSEALSQAKFTD